MKFKKIFQKAAAVVMAAVTVFSVLPATTAFAAVGDLKCEGKDYKGENLLSLSGVYQPKKELKDSTIPIALSTFLKANPQIKTLYLHLDNDNTGRRCTAALKVLLQKDYEIVDAPPPVGKDVNDFLLSYLGIGQQKTYRERGDVR